MNMKTKKEYGGKGCGLGITAKFAVATYKMRNEIIWEAEMKKKEN